MGADSIHSSDITENGLQYAVHCVDRSTILINTIIYQPESVVISFN